MTITQKAILKEIRTSGQGGRNDEIMVNYKSLENELGYTRTTLKRAVRGLVRDGFMKHCPAVDMDGIPCGSGFVLTDDGERKADELGYEKD